MRIKVLFFIFCLVFSFSANAQQYNQGFNADRGSSSTARSNQATRPAKLTNREITNAIGDTAFFRDYIKKNPHVLPDIKLRGNAEW